MIDWLRAQRKIWASVNRLAPNYGFVAKLHETGINFVNLLQCDNRCISASKLTTDTYIASVRTTGNGIKLAELSLMIGIIDSSAVFWAGIQSAEGWVPQTHRFESWSHQRKATCLHSIRKSFFLCQCIKINSLYVCMHVCMYVVCMQLNNL